MFGFFNGRKRRQEREQEKRVSFFYQQCVEGIEEYVKNHPNPSYEDILIIAVNAKIFYELFKNVSGLKSKLRGFAEPYVMNAPAAIIQLEGVELEDAVKRVVKIFDCEIKALFNDQSTMILPSVKSAYLMSTLIGFNEMSASIT